MDKTVQQEPAQNNHPKRKQLLIELTIIFIAVAVVFIVYWLGWGRYLEYTDDAYVNGNLIQLMPQISGTVVAINTDDTHFVVAGEPLVRLDGADTRIAFEHAKAALALTVRQVKQLYENAGQAKALLSLREADLLRAQLDLKRRQGLIGNRAISREELQHYLTALKTAQNRYDVANHNLGATLALVNNTHLYDHPYVNKAKEVLKKAYLNYQRTIIYAPATGYVAKRNVQVGQQVNPNSAMLAIVPFNQIWIDANYKESQLDRIRIGQSVSVTADAYDDVSFHGKVVGLGAGTGAAFALLPAQNATGNWIKIVQRLPVRIALDPNEIKKYPLRIGLSMRITTHTNSLQGGILNQRIDKQSLYTTHIYQNQLAKVDALITLILQANSPDVTFTNGTVV